MLQSYWQKRVAAFKHAFRGLGDLLRNHPHAHWHLFFSLLIVVIGCFLDFAKWEWVSIVICMGLVWSAEAFNTAIEYWTDLVSPEIHHLAGKAKDMAAAAVLCASLAALVVGLLIVLPKIWEFIL